MNRIKIGVIALSALLILGEGFAHEVDNFIGLTEVRTDKRVKSYSGYILESPVSGSRIPYGASIIQTYRNDYYFLIQQNVGENSRKPIWKVVSQFKAPRINDEDYFYKGFNCIRNGKQDRKIIALVLYEKNEVILRKVEKAWIINTESLTIESISAEDIACENELYGSD